MKKTNHPKPCRYRDEGKQVECSLSRSSLRCPDHEDPALDKTVGLTKQKKKRGKKK